MATSLNIGRFVVCAASCFALWGDHELNRAQTRTTDPKSGVISGKVTDAHSGVAIPDALVQMGQAGAPSESQLTDELGRFAFTQLASGAYLLRASKGGFTDTRFGPTIMGVPSGAISLDDGEWFRSADIRLNPLVAIGGRLTDESGEPVVSAFVRVMTVFDLGTSRQYAVGPVARTDDRGEYRIPGLPAGRYYVFVPCVQHTVPRGWSAGPAGRLIDGLSALILGSYVTPPPPVAGHLRTYPITFFPGSRTVQEAQLIDVATGGTSAIDFSLRPASAVRISGRLVGAVASYEGMVLRLVQAGLETLGNGSEVATAVVAMDGSFSFLHVPAGDYTLLAPGVSFEYAFASAGGPGTGATLPPTPGIGQSGSGTTGGTVAMAPGISRTALAPASITDDRAGYARVPLRVGDSDIQGMRVALEPTGSMTVRVVFEDFTRTPPLGTLEVAGADPAAGLGVRTIVLRPPSGEEPSPTYSARLLLPGAYVIRPIGMAGAALKSVSLDGRDFSARPLPIGSGHAAGVTVTLTGKAARVSGVTRHEDGTAVAGAIVIAYPTDRELWTNYGFTPTWIRATASSTKGTFSLVGLREGDYYVVALHAPVNAWADQAFLEAATRSAKRLKLSWGDTAVLDLPLSSAR